MSVCLNISRRVFLTFSFLLCCFGTVVARTWTVEELPIPYLQDRTQYVSNPDHILQQPTLDSLNRILLALERDKGIQSLVVVLDKVEGGDPYEFGMELGRKYGVGNKSTRTGLIVVLAKGDRRYYFLTGNGLEGTLPDAMVQRIEDAIFVPRLKQGDWDGAMLESIKAIDKICRGDETLPQLFANESEDNAWPILTMLGLIFVAFGAIAYYSHRLKHRPRVCPRCGRKTYHYVKEHRGYTHRRSQRYIVTTTTYRCDFCNYTDHERKETRDNDPDGVLMGTLWASLLAGRGRGGFTSGGSFGGGSLGGGSFGGGSFGGGGSGGRF